jgi:hypothetical protein
MIRLALTASSCQLSHSLLRSTDRGELFNGKFTHLPPPPVKAKLPQQQMRQHHKNKSGLSANTSAVFSQNQASPLLVKNQIFMPSNRQKDDAFIL